MEKNKIYKDEVKEILLRNFDNNIDISRINFLKEHIDEVVRVMLAGEASARAGLSEEYKQALKEDDFEFAEDVRDRVMQEIYEGFGCTGKLPTSVDIRNMKRKHISDLKYLKEHGASGEFIEIQMLHNQLEHNLLLCQRGELPNQFCAKDKTVIRISCDVLADGNNKIEMAKKRYEDKHSKVKSKR